jgi:DNA-binding MarR family transcriptional regulator
VRGMNQKALEHCDFGMALSDRIRRWRKLTDKSISPLGLTLGEFRVLRVLSESGPTPMVDLAREQMITQAAMTSIVDHLEELKLIERMRNETDRRVIRVGITSRGEEEVKKGLKLYKKFIEKATQNLTSNEIRNLLASLDHMLESAESA